jgi:hypothetical protein
MFLRGSAVVGMIPVRLGSISVQSACKTVCVYVVR